MDCLVNRVRIRPNNAARSETLLGVTLGRPLAPTTSPVEFLLQQSCGSVFGVKLWPHFAPFLALPFFRVLSLPRFAMSLLSRCETLSGLSRPRRSPSLCALKGHAIHRHMSHHRRREPLCSFDMINSPPRSKFSAQQSMSDVEVSPSRARSHRPTAPAHPSPQRTQSQKQER